MTQSEEQSTNARYLKSAIAQLYSENANIILGLTGRTGSGCSTVASLLTRVKPDLHHNLFRGTNPQNSEQRKEQIVRRYFEASWVPFQCIQVSAIITTFLLEVQPDVLESGFKRVLDDKAAIPKCLDLLRALAERNTQAEAATDRSTMVSFYCDELPRKTGELRNSLGEKSFVHLYQILGKNLRLSGSPFSESLKQGKSLVIAKRVERVLNAIRGGAEKMTGEPVRIVIDAIRNPLEALYFQNRYADFLLLAVTAPDKERRSRLLGKNLTDADVVKIDKAEYTSHEAEDADYYSVQDIQACLQRADLYVSNPDVPSLVEKHQSLAAQLIKFIALLSRPGIVTPSPVERCMQVAYTAKLNSGCISRQVGAAVTDQFFSIRSIGWNDVPQGQVPCNLRSREDLLGGTDAKAYSTYEKNNGAYLDQFRERSGRFANIAADGRNNAYCFKSEYSALTKERNQVHTRSLHAEENAFLQLAKHGSTGIVGGFLFTTASPCELCAKKAYQLGMTRIYYIDPYPGIATEHIICGGEANPELILFSGAIGRAFHRLYSPIVPQKDELHALTADECK